VNFSDIAEVLEVGRLVAEVGKRSIQRSSAIRYPRSLFSIPAHIDVDSRLRAEGLNDAYEIVVDRRLARAISPMAH